MKIRFTVHFFILFYALAAFSPWAQGQEVLFESDFETVADFDGFYIVPNDPDGSTAHSLDDTISVSGTTSHLAWILRPNGESSLFSNRNHRAYPTVQFQNTEKGPVQTPVCVSLFVWADFDLQPRQSPHENQWFSIATFTDDISDRWKRTVLVNVAHDGGVHLQHTTGQGEQEHVYRSNDVQFPFRQWVHFQIELDFSAAGYAKVWLEGTLVALAEVRDITGRLGQAHFGLYAEPSIASGVIRNDDLSIVAGVCR